MQKKIGVSKNIVMDGRDIGISNNLNAKIKLFVISKVEITGTKKIVAIEKCWIRSLI